MAKASAGTKARPIKSVRSNINQGLVLADVLLILITTSQSNVKLQGLSYNIVKIW